MATLVIAEVLPIPASAMVRIAFDARSPNLMVRSLTALLLPDICPSGVAASVLITLHTGGPFHSTTIALAEVHEISVAQVLVAFLAGQPLLPIGGVAAL